MGCGASSGSGGGLFRSRSARVLIAGLDQSGKTTFLYMLKLGEKVNTIPTIGFNVESVKIKKVDFNVWDVGGQDKIRPLWRHYTENISGFLFFVDSTDHGRMTWAGEELVKTLPLLDKSCVIIIVVNKIDLPNSMKADEVREKLEIDKHTTERTVHICEICSFDKEGVHGVMDLLAQALKK